MPVGQDRYAVLELQGTVCGVPTYDRKAKKLCFKVSPSQGVTLPMVATGETAKAFKSLLNSGVLIQAKALPRQEIVALGDGSQAIATVWHARKIQVLSFKKTRLKEFSDLRILDGLMPEDDDYQDVGFVEPESWGRFSSYREAKAKREGNGND